MKDRRRKITLGALLVVWVAVAMWAWSAFQPRPQMAAVVAPADEEITFFLQEGGVVDLHLDWLDSEARVGPPVRDLFSTAPIVAAVAGQEGPGTEGPSDPGAVEAAPVQPAVAATLQYMGYVETAGGTLALLRDGSQMYLAREGNRVGPGYLVAIVDEAFVEIEFKGARRRLPVSRQEGGSDGRQ